LFREVWHVLEVLNLCLNVTVGHDATVTTMSGRSTTGGEITGVVGDGTTGHTPAVDDVITASSAAPSSERNGSANLSTNTYSVTTSVTSSPTLTGVTPGNSRQLSFSAEILITDTHGQVRVI